MLRRTLLLLCVVLLLTTTALWGLKYRADRRFYEGYCPEHPLNATESPPEIINDTVKAFGQTLPARYRRIAFSFDTQPGERVPAILTLPLHETDPAPVLILLHGSHQEKEFVEEICSPFNEAGFAMVSFDQYMRGERRVTGGPATIALAFRDRCRRTVHDTRRLIDYLKTRSDIDRDRIYLVGASYGAITGTVVVAQDKRIQAAALIVGGGDFRLIAQAPEVQRELPGWLLPLAGRLLVLVAGVADPVHHAAHTAGIPVIMLNGANDGVVIPEAGEALYAALGEPKEIRWYPIDHPDREPDGAKVIELLEDGLKWFLERDAEIVSQRVPAETAEGN